MAETAPGPAAPARGGRRMRASLAVAVLLGLLGFGAVTQIRSTADDPLASARQTDLVRILGDLDAQAQRLQAEIADLTAAKTQLATDAEGVQAQEQARRRTEVLGILAGTIPATGPGVEVTLSGSGVNAATVLNAVQELRDAGAEAIEVSGQRVVATTSFSDGPNGGLVVNGATVTGPYRIVAIGDGGTLDAAMRIPGGLVDTVASGGGQVTVQARDTVRVDAVVPLSRPSFAAPKTD